MRCFFVFLTLCPVVTLSTTPFFANSNGRRLEDGDGNSYTYLNDLSSYHTRFGKCIRVKVPNDNDGEGNSYFYNNRYHAQYIPYASFHTCESDGDDSCGNCDYSTHYAIDLESYLEANVVYIQNYCEACAENCGDRRRVEDGDDNVQNYAQGENFCTSCTDQCSLILAGRDGTDETNYLGCQQSDADENGVQYYSGPQCSSDGNIVIGLFYDDECTVKSSSEYDLEFSYNSFETVENICIDCSLDDTCGDLYAASSHCLNGKTYYGDDDDLPVCKTYKIATMEWVYAVRQKSIGGQVLLGVMVVAFTGMFGFLVYSYYVRHTRKIPLASLDNDTTSAANFPQVS